MSTKFINIPHRWFYGIGDYLRNPKYYLKTINLWKNNIGYIYKCLKWCWQRAFRGWADCDWWDMDSYLIDIIVPMLKKLKEDGHGYPGHDEASTPEKWDALLDEMIEGFEAAGRVIDDDYYKEVSGDSIESIRNASRKEIMQWVVMSKADQKLFEEKARIFIKYFFALWD